MKKIAFLKKCFVFVMVVALLCPLIPVSASTTMPYYNGIENFKLDLKNVVDWEYLTEGYYSAFYRYNKTIDNQKNFYSMISKYNTEVPVPLIGVDTLFGIKFPNSWLLSESDFGEIYVYGAYFSKDEYGRILYAQDELAHYARHQESNKTYAGTVDDFFSTTNPVNLYDFVADKPSYSAIVIKAWEDTYGSGEEYFISANVIGIIADRFTNDMFTSAPTFPLTDIKLSQYEIRLVEGEATTLEAALTPYYTTQKNIVWSSDNTKVATVDSTGKLTAVAAGTTAIKATIGDKIASCKVTVTKSVGNVTFKANGGKFDSKKKALTVKREDLKNALGQIATPKRSKYIFKGWYTKAKGGKKVTAKNCKKIGNNAKLYAHWSKVSK